MPIDRVPIIDINMRNFRRQRKRQKQEITFFDKEDKDDFIRMFKQEWVKTGLGTYMKQEKRRDVNGNWAYDVHVRINPKDIMQFTRDVIKYGGILP